MGGGGKRAEKKIAELVTNYISNGYKYKEICILTTKTEEKSFLADVDKIGRHKIVTTRTGDGVLFTTARKFKGLESDVVILIDVDQNTFENDENKRLFYAGASRAKHKLDIIHIRDDKDLEGLVSNIPGKKVNKVLADLQLGLNIKAIDCR